MRSNEISWEEIKKVKDIINVECHNLDELIAMVYLLSDNDCRSIVTDRLSDIANSENSQYILGLIHDNIAESKQRKLLRRILTSKQSISITEKLFKHRTGVIHEDIVNLWSGLSVVVENTMPTELSISEYIKSSMDFIIDYFEGIKIKSKNILNFNQAKVIVVSSIREMLSVSREIPNYTDFSLLKIASTKMIKPITLMHFYILSLAFAIRGSRIFCIEDTPCLRLNNGYFYISNFPDQLFTEDSAKLLLSKHGINVGMLYKDNSEADFIKSLLLRFYRNGIIKKGLYKVINSSLKHYNNLLNHERASSIHSVE